MIYKQIKYGSNIDLLSRMLPTVGQKQQNVSTRDEFSLKSKWKVYVRQTPSEEIRKTKKIDMTDKIETIETRQLIWYEHVMGMEDNGW